MPRYEHEEIGKIYRTKKVKTFGDKVKEFFEGLAAWAFILVILYFVFT